MNILHEWLTFEGYHVRKRSEERVLRRAVYVVRRPANNRQLQMGRERVAELSQCCYVYSNRKYVRRKIDALGLPLIMHHTGLLNPQRMMHYEVPRR